MAISTESRFFGLDLTQLKGDFLNTWRKSRQWAPLSWLQPEQLLTLVPADGQPRAVWESGEAAHVKKPAVFWALELPESMVLRKNLQMPALDPQDCLSAMQLEAQANSPFGAQDSLWGYTELQRNSKQVRLQLVLASRAAVEPYVQRKMAELQQAQADNKGIPAPEVWVFTPDGKPIVFAGFGENARYQAAKKQLKLNVAGAFVALMLLLGIAITPTSQLRLRAIEAVKAFDGMVAKAGDVVSKRERLMQSADQVASLSDFLAERIDMVKVLSMLTSTLGDDTALQTVRVQGNKLAMTGLTGNSSALMQKLSSQPGISDVKAPSAATRIQGTDKESFSIELALDPKEFGPTLKQEAPVEPPKSPVQEGTVAGDPAQTAGTPATAAATTQEGAAPATPPKRRGASLGGGGGEVVAPSSAPAPAAETGGNKK
ncbi:PilN domain-containing protein [Comamonas sp. J-3]|uniref:PilN domain-containing protein n=1 Tax=Comamonas trifloxystrobinivorans TaxID=3350256 RepID=UPI0037264AFA